MTVLPMDINFVFLWVVSPFSFWALQWCLVWLAYFCFSVDHAGSLTDYVFWAWNRQIDFWI